jgi:Ribonuclease G/E
VTIWEKAVLNMQKGSRKIAAAAAVFSERIKAELTIIRLKIRIDEVQRRMDGFYGMIGRRIVDLRTKEALPKAVEQLLRDENITTAMTEITNGEQEMEQLKTEIKTVGSGFAPEEKKTEDTIA